MNDLIPFPTATATFGSSSVPGSHGSSLPT